MKTRLHHYIASSLGLCCTERASVSMPWRMLPLLFVGFWTTDAIVGTLFDHHSTLWAELLSVEPHEVFMRLSVGTVLTIAAMLWSRSIAVQNERIDALEAAEDNLRSMAAALAAGDAENKRALAQRLHENVGQSLAAAQMYLAGIHLGADAGEDAKSLRAASLVVGSAIAECRDVAQDLAPSGLEAYGLLTALETLRERMMKRTGVSIELRGDAASCELGNDAMLAAFQALSDTIEFAATHPDTSLVQVDSVQDGSSLHFIVSWDAPSEQPSTGSYEWLRVTGGSVGRIKSARPSALRLTVPISRAA